MNPAQPNRFLETLAPLCKDSVRVLVMKHVQGDTYAIFEDGGVYLSDGAALKMLLQQLSGRSSP